MTQRPRLQLIAPVQIRLLTNVEINFEQFKKGDVVTIEEHQADDLIDAKKAEDVGESEQVDSVNRFTVVTPTKAETKAADTTSSKLAAAAQADAKQASATATTAKAATPAVDAKTVDLTGTTGSEVKS